mmetsp:Transcript_28804/g.92202  ORF Transcript_28804/g.92202 Transcript_28804/m.92202 type:complete len:217 (+) Transcript_28804:169-819(+)
MRALPLVYSLAPSREVQRRPQRLLRGGGAAAAPLIHPPPCGAETLGHGAAARSASVGDRVGRRALLQLQLDEERRGQQRPQQRPGAGKGGRCVDDERLGEEVRVVGLHHPRQLRRAEPRLLREVEAAQPGHVHHQREGGRGLREAERADRGLLHRYPPADEAVHVGERRSAGKRGEDEGSRARLADDLVERHALPKIAHRAQLVHPVLPPPPKRAL